MWKQSLGQITVYKKPGTVQLHTTVFVKQGTSSSHRNFGAVKRHKPLQYLVAVGTNAQLMCA